MMWMHYIFFEILIQNIYVYFNYHSKVKKLIDEDEIIKIEILDEYHGIKPAMVIYFKNNPPMPIREHKWDEYINYLFLTNNWAYLNPLLKDCAVFD